MNVVDKNHSFNSCSSNNELYKKMFPDYQIVKDYEISSTKVMYVIRHGIGVHVKSIIDKEVNGRPFTFHFDESTTNQVKKQYDGYIRYYSLEISLVFCQNI